MFIYIHFLTNISKAQEDGGDNIIWRFFSIIVEIGNLVYSAVLSKISYIFVLKWSIYRYHLIFTMNKILSTINF